MPEWPRGHQTQNHRFEGPSVWTPGVVNGATRPTPEWSDPLLPPPPPTSSHLQLPPPHSPSPACVPTPTPVKIAPCRTTDLLVPCLPPPPRPIPLSCPFTIPGGPHFFVIQGLSRQRGVIRSEGRQERCVEPVGCLGPTLADRAAHLDVLADYHPRTLQRTLDALVVLGPGPCRACRAQGPVAPAPQSVGCPGASQQ